MANRRMFSKRIISSARFMKLTKDAQVLYFHLCLNADDDGAVEGYPVRRSIGIEEDAYVNLVGRGFVTILDEDNEVLYINDWHEHNKIRADRIQTSVYRGLIQAKIGSVALIEPKQRSDVKGNKIIDVSAGQEPDGQAKDGGSRSSDGPRTDAGRSTDGPRTDNGQSMDGLGEVRVGEVRLGQDSLGQASTGEEKRDKRKRAARPSEPKHRHGEYKHVLITDKELEKLKADFPNDYSRMIRELDEYLELHPSKSYANHNLTMRRWEREDREKRSASQPASKQKIVTRTPEEMAAQPKWGLFND